jgi:hypothetical protein
MPLKVVEADLKGCLKVLTATLKGVLGAKGVARSGQHA